MSSSRLLLCGLAIALLAAACSSASSDLEAEVSELRGEVSNLSDDVAALAAEMNEDATEPGSTTTSTVTTTTTAPPAATTTTVATTTTRLPAGVAVTFEGTGKTVEPVPALSADQILIDVTINSGTVTLTETDGGQAGFVWVNENYDGTTRLRDPEDIAFIDVNPDSTDPWTVTIRTFEATDIRTVPSTIDGVGDSVFVVSGSSGASIVTVDGSCTGRYGQISVQAYSAENRSLEWTVFDPSDGDLPGDMLMPPDTTFVAVEGESCEWSIDWP
jgi:hypothetical protein